jgi:hypothetical protein
MVMQEPEFAVEVYFNRLRAGAKLGVTCQLRTCPARPFHFGKHDYVN